MEPEPVLEYEPLDETEEDGPSVAVSKKDEPGDGAGLEQVDSISKGSVDSGESLDDGIRKM